MKRQKIQLKDIMSQHSDMEYQQLYAYVMELIKNKALEPMKTAKSNGRTPALPISFWRYEEETDYTDVYEELKYKYHPLINTSYYRKHPERYEADKHNLQLLSNYLKNHSNLLKIKETMNERSFEIFHREKYFQREGGLEFCKRVAIDADKLAFYETSEPLSYYSYSKQAPQNILIIENKDTFFDIRRYMNTGCNHILGKEFGTVIYGAGKGIWKTFADYMNGAETYFMGDNKLFYFGDLDYEGILIYERLVESTSAIIYIFEEAYTAMLDKAMPKFQIITDQKSIEKYGGSKMYFAPPIDYDKVMKKIPYGKVITVGKIREYFAELSSADFTEPITAGIFVSIVAWASYQRSEDETPYWRTLKANGELNAKYPNGIEAQKEKLEAEGHTIIQKGRKNVRYYVKDYENSLFDLK